MAPVLGQLSPGVRHLHIIPEGVLHYVPFAALQRPDGAFLVQQYTLSVAPSISVLKLCRARNPGQWRSMLLLGDPDGRLPGSRREVTSIARSAPSRRLALVGSQAAKSMLDSLAYHYDIIHLATHGVFNARTPAASSLQLAGEDLTVDEIARLRLDAYLVTLSACETGLGGGAAADVPDGDEWVGLYQGFLAAGAPTVMATLWPIDDAVSSRLMVDFYERLGRAGKSAALAAVQRRMIAGAATRHPYYWAPFTIIGDPL